MFGGPDPAVASREEIQLQEREANATIQFTVATCVVLYLTPFALNYVGKLF